ncbi:MAG: calcium/sodium antiporter [Geminicoccaceae bacterium]
MLQSLPVPPVFLWSLFLVIALLVLVQAADWFTEAAERIGLAFGLPSFVVGVTIVAIGTSLPEVVASVLAVLEGASEIVAGNVVGSNIANLMLVLGIGAILTGRLCVHYDLNVVDLPFLVGSAFFLAIILLNGSVGRIEAVMCLFGVCVYMHYALTNRHVPVLAEPDELPEPPAGKVGLARTLAVLFGAGLLIYLGAEGTIWSVIELAAIAGIGREVIAASAVAVGTSLPEVVVTVSAARRDRAELAVGNLLGSNVFNAFAVIGISAMIGELYVPESIINFALPLMIVGTLLTVFIMMRREMTAWEGWLMLMFYAYFLTSLFQPM